MIGISCCPKSLLHSVETDKMGRHELIEKIAAQSPHLDRRDVEIIVETVVEAFKGGDLDEGGSDVRADNRLSSAERDNRDSEALTRLVDLISQMPDEVLDQPLDEVDPELVRSVFNAISDSVARSADMLDDTARENRRYRDEFDRRSQEIHSLQRSIDARLQRLVG